MEHMRRFSAVVIGGFASILAVTAVGATAQHPSWAYGFFEPPPPPGAPAAAAGRGGAERAPATTVHTVPGSQKTYTQADVNNGFAPPDWFPSEHPAMPEIVAHGRRAATINACSQ